jgi:hypothetical protein
LNILSMKLKANRCANTTQGIHIIGMDPPYAGSMTAAVLLLLIYGLTATCCWSTGLVQSLFQLCPVGQPSAKSQTIQSVESVPKVQPPG